MNRQTEIARKLAARRRPGARRRVAVLMPT
jgi:hypothetical protein